MPRFTLPSLERLFKLTSRVQRIRPHLFLHISPQQLNRMVFVSEQALVDLRIEYVWYSSGVHLVCLCIEQKRKESFSDRWMSLGGRGIDSLGMGSVVVRRNP